MKILVVSNLYPPHHNGGYELGCRDVVEKLRHRGHAVRVLTSTFRHDDRPETESGVERVLQFNHAPGDPPHDKRAEARKLAECLRRFGPDVVYFWNLAGLSLWLPFAAHWQGGRLAFFLSDTNFVSWRIGAWLLRWAEGNSVPLALNRSAGVPPALGEETMGGGESNWEGTSRKNRPRQAGQRPALPTSAQAMTERTVRSHPSPTGRSGEVGLLSAAVHALLGKSFLVRGWPVIAQQTCHFCSDFLRQLTEKHGIPVAPRDAVVTHWGIDLNQFAVTPRPRWPVRRLLYAGQMIPQKGVHTAIAAFAQLAKEPAFADLTFTLAGGGMHPDYETGLRVLAEQLGVAGRVRFAGRVPRAELVRLYAEHDVLVFPSEWDEPFAITPLEAMYCGLAVAGTTTGGSGELFRHRETAMTFRAGDAADCARALRELGADRDLFETLTRNAQREVREKHTLDAMVDKIEGSLLKMLTC